MDRPISMLIVLNLLLLPIVIAVWKVLRFYFLVVLKCYIVYTNRVIVFHARRQTLPRRRSRVVLCVCFFFHFFIYFLIFYAALRLLSPAQAVDDDAHTSCASRTRPCVYYIYVNTTACSVHCGSHAREPGNT